MTAQITPVELNHHLDQGEIREKPEDTPRSVSIDVAEQTWTGGQTYTNKTLLALATATQIFGSSGVGLTDYLLTSKDMTTFSNEAPVGQHGEYFPYPVSMLEAQQESDADAANRIRLELLARLYVSKKLSPQEDARLAIVTEKVRRLIPRVTIEDFEALGEIAQDAQTIRTENEALRRRLGI
jgi:hypothetical protein